MHHLGERVRGLLAFANIFAMFRARRLQLAVCGFWVFPLILVGCGGNGVSATGTSPTTAPVIGSFSATPSSITAGSSSSLAWNATAATSFTLSSVTGTVDSPVSVAPATTTTYTLTAINSVGSTSATATVSVLPGINAFSASALSINAGQPVTFSWTTTDANSVTLSGLTVTPSSPVTIYPNTTGSYDLSATNAAGTTSRSIGITVIPVSLATANIGTSAGLQVPADFMGLAVGESNYEPVFGYPSTGVNTVLRQIMKNITAYGAAPLTYKITAYEQYPASAATYVPTAAQVSTINQLAADTGATFFVGVNMAADSPSIAVTQAQAYASQMTTGSLIGLEIGNEPDNYILSSENYRTAPYAFLTDYAGFALPVLTALQISQPSAKLVGPAWGQPSTTVGGNSKVVSNSNTAVTMSNFLTSFGSSVGLVTQHGYANQCIGGTTNYTADFLLTPAAQNCVSTSYLLGGVAPAHALNLKYRIDETNSMVNGGVSGISNTFQGALWIMDWAAGLAKGGVDGINIFGDSANQYYTMFTFNQSGSAAISYTLNYVTPQYYGVLMFQQATQNSAKFLPVTLVPTGNQVIYAWIAADSTIRALVINKDETGLGNVTLTLPTGYGNGAVTRLLEVVPNITPLYNSTSGVLFDGQTLDASILGTESTNATLQGIAFAETIVPNGSNNTYTLALPATSAALITIPHE